MVDLTETVAFEVWRVHHNGGPDVRVHGPTTEPIARSYLEDCAADKAARYPNAPLDFYLARATTVRERIT